MLLLFLGTLSLTAAALPETNSTHKRNAHAFNPKHSLKNYIEILTHAPFVVYTFSIVAGFYYSIIIILFAIIARIYVSMISLEIFGSTKTLFQELKLIEIALALH